VQAMVKQKSIYFSACGIGLGHVGRLKPFARWLFQEGHKIYFTGYGEAMDQLKDDKFIKHTVPVIEFYENPDGSFNSSKTSIVGLYLTFRFLQQVKVEYQYITKYKPDLVVADTRYSTVFAAKKYKLAGAELPILFITNQRRTQSPRILIQYPNGCSIGSSSLGSYHALHLRTCQSEMLYVKDTFPMIGH